MTDPSSVEEIYRRVIDDTVQKLAPEFENAGVSLQVLARLQTVWTASMSAALRPQIPMVPAHLELPNAVPSRVLASSSYAHASSSSAKSAHDQKVDHKGAANSSSAPAAAAAPTDALRYTVNEPTVIVKDEHAETSSATETANGNSAPAPAAVQPVNGEAKAQTSASEATDASEAVKVKVEGDSDSDSSDVSDEEELDTSTWTNSLMSLYEEPIKRTKTKRTYKLLKGIMHVDGKDYLFKSGKAEFDWK